VEKPNKMLTRSTNKIRLQYLSFFLKKFNKLSQDFQSEEIARQVLISKIEGFYLSFARMLLNKESKNLNLFQILDINL